MLESLKNSFIVIKRPNFWPLVIVILAALLAGRGLIGEGYFNMHDDLQMMRQLEMEKCFLDGQIPCRWVPDMGYGFGYPLFNFYPPLPYLTGQLFRVVGYSFVDTVKLTFILSFLVSGITMYFLSKEFFGKLGGIVSAIFYIWAPYHAVDVYVRGAMNEAWALMWFPIILWTSYRLIIEKKKVAYWVIGLSLSWFALFTSHNLMVIIFTPIFAAWCLLWVIKSRNISSIVSLLVSGSLAFGLAAFFTLPVFLEKQAVQTDTLVVGYYEYTAHFASIRQLLFSRFWGYGPSVWMDIDDGMSFQVGWIHWILSIVVGALALYKFVRDRKLPNYLLVTVFLILTGWFAAFMAHPRSTPIWGLINELKYVQFPWRFLTIVILSFSLIAGAITKLLPKTLSYITSIILIFAVLIYSWNFFLPEHGKLGPLTDEEKFTGAAWDLQQTAGIYDYLPNTAKTAPKAPQSGIAEITEGEARITDASQGTNWAKFSVEADTDTVVRIGIMDFPDWKVTVDGKDQETFIPETEEWGRMYVSLPQGGHMVELHLEDTAIRKIGNIISLVTWIILGMYLIRMRSPRSQLNI